MLKCIETGALMGETTASYAHALCGCIPGDVHVPRFVRTVRTRAGFSGVADEGGVDCRGAVEGKEFFILVGPSSAYDRFSMQTEFSISGLIVPLVTGIACNGRTRF
jgi:hypothetical protein